MKFTVSLLGCEVLAFTWGAEWGYEDDGASLDGGTTGSIAIDAHRIGFGRYDEIPGDDTE